MIIGIDIDGVLANFMDLFQPYLKKKYGVKTINPFAYRIFKRFSVKSQNVGLDLLMKFAIGGGYEKLKPYQDAIDFFNGLKADKILITSRYPVNKKWNKQVKEKITKDTQKWLSKYKVEYKKLIFTKDKVKHIVENKVDVFFEDFYENAEKIGKVMPRSFLVTRDWNVKERPIKSIRISNVEDAEEYLKG